MNEIVHPKTIKKKGIWTQNGVSYKTTKNADTTFLHSHDELY